MSTWQHLYSDEITPEQIAEATHRARIERSRAFWRLLEGIFKSAADDLPTGPAAKAVR